MIFVVSTIAEYLAQTINTAYAVGMKDSIIYRFPLQVHQGRNIQNINS